MIMCTLSSVSECSDGMAWDMCVSNIESPPSRLSLSLLPRVPVIRQVWFFNYFFLLPSPAPSVKRTETRMRVFPFFPSVLLEPRFRPRDREVVEEEEEKVYSAHAPV